MTRYVKPLFAPVHADRETAGCCFYYNNAGQGFYYYNGGGRPTDVGEINASGVLAGTQNDIVTVGNNGGSVTPLCNTGLPATQPQTFGVPVGVTGVTATVDSSGSPTVTIDTANIGASVAGNSVHITPVGCGQPVC